VAIDADRVTAIGPELGPARDEVDAEGLVVTPGFVDVHTHLDAQLWWDPAASPGTWHGITSVVMGNCGVTFAPVRPGGSEYLATMMESVEDIPARAILDGLPWTWTTYGDFLRELASRPLGPNVGGLVGHCALRYYAMGDDSLSADAAPRASQATMETLVREALDSGALGLSTSRTELHMVPDGRPVPGTFAPPSELRALAGVLGDAGTGVLGAVTRLHEERGDTIDQTLAEIDLLGEIALSSGRPVTFNLTQGRVAGLHERILERVHDFRSRGAQLWPQTTVRPIGWLYSIANRTPFDRNPSWRALRGRPLDEKLLALASHATRADLVAEVERNPPAVDPARIYAFPPGAARYDLGDEHSLAAHARARGVSVAEAFVDMALESGGTQVFTWPIFNDQQDAVETMITDPGTMLGLADAGAHVGQIMDASQPSYVLSYWMRDRKLLTLEDAVRRLTSQPASIFGIEGRGVLAPGAPADVNVIDVERLALHHPEFVNDLPNGAGRFVQRAEGYRWTWVNGTAVLADGNRTGALPGHML
jgi:N-acyl-D-aspartate/D-glutamate deacylase